VLAVAGIAAGGGLAAETASGAAELRVRDRLTFTQPDGTPVAFGPEIRVWCGPWASDVPVPSIHVQIGTRAGARSPVLWELHAVVAHVKRRPVVRLPRSFIWNRPKGALLFATDGRNEVNSDQDDSTGSIRFRRVSCGRRLRIAFRFDGRLGSEFSDGVPLTVRGSFRASASAGTG
jgi:hypothetical protein